MKEYKYAAKYLNTKKKEKFTGQFSINDNADINKVIENFKNLNTPIIKNSKNQVVCFKATI